MTTVPSRAVGVGVGGCTCLWSPVGTTTLDPPYLVTRNADCPVHGGQDLIYADLMAGRCSHTQAIERLMEQGWDFPAAIDTVAQWVNGDVP